MSDPHKGGRLIGPDQYDSHVWLWRLTRTIAADVASYGNLLRYEYSQDVGKPHWTAQWGRDDVTYDYGWDVGNLHVIDYRLWLAELPIRRPFAESPRSLRFSPADWSH